MEYLTALCTKDYCYRWLGRYFGAPHVGKHSMHHLAGKVLDSITSQLICIHPSLLAFRILSINSSHQLSEVPADSSCWQDGYIPYIYIYAWTRKLCRWYSRARSVHHLLISLQRNSFSMPNFRFVRVRSYAPKAGSRFENYPPYSGKQNAWVWHVEYLTFLSGCSLGSVHTVLEV